MLSTKRSVFVILLSLIFFPFAVAALCLGSAEAILFRAQSYQKALRDRGVYDQIVPLLSETIISRGVSKLQSVEQQAVGRLSANDYQKIIQIILPKDVAYAQLDFIIQQLFDFLNFNTKNFTVMLELRPVKAALGSNPSSEIASTIVNSWPPCQLSDALQLGALALNGNFNNWPMCKPPQEILIPAIQIVDTYLPVLASKIPDQFDLVKLIDLSPDNQQSLQKAFDYYYALRLIWRLSPIIALAILIFIMIISWETTPKMLGWSGAQLLQAGLATMLTALLLLLGNILLVNNFSQQPGIGEPLAQLGFLILQSIADVFTQFTITSTIASLTVTLVGAGAMLAAYWIGQKNRL